MSAAFRLLILETMMAASFCSAFAAGNSVTRLPEPETDAPPAETAQEQVAVLAGGCFWGVEAVFEHVKGVKKAESGYAGGDGKDARYDAVSTGRTGHAEAVRIVFDPAQISYGRLLKIFFAVAHDPTQVDRQGPDVGRQYRSAIFFADLEQKRIAQAYVEQLDRARLYDKPIATRIEPLAAFYPAEAYHQDYLARHPDQPYIVMHDLPKLEQLRQVFPELYRPGKRA